MLSDDITKLFLFFGKKKLSNYNLPLNGFGLQNVVVN